MFTLKSHPIDHLRNKAFVWFCDTSRFAPEQIKACLRLLSNHESHRHSAIRSTPDAYSYAISHALLRMALSSLVNTHTHTPSPGEWQFTAGPSGKPEISPAQNDPDLRFNISHSKDACAIIITQGRDCGIDIENTSRETDYIKIARKMFHTDEVAQLAESENIRHDFFRLWTLREARAKATGEGLANSAGKFGFHLADDDIGYRCHDKNSDYKDWQFATLEPLRSHIAAVAIERRGTELDIYTRQIKP